MRRSTGVIILVIAAVLFTTAYYESPAFKGFIFEHAAFLTFFGVLLAIFSLWYVLVENNESSIDEKGDLKEKEKVEAILSPVAGLCIGREKELSTLEDDLTHKNILLIKGIAGIGKTTLGRTLKDRLEKKGYKTFWSHIGYDSYEGFLFELSQYLKERGSKYAGYITQEANPEKRFKIAVQELCRYPTVVFLDDFQKLKDDSIFSIFRDYLQNSTLVVMSRVQPTFLLEDYESLSCLGKQASVTLLKQLGLIESDAVLEEIFLKTQGHPWSLERFVRFSYKLPVKKLFAEIPDFSEKQEDYINEQCWNTLKKGEKDFLMRVSVFIKPLDFDGLEVCSKNLTTVLVSLAENFYITKRGEYYYIHDLIRDFALLQLKKDADLYGEAHRKAAGYHRENISAENLLLGHYHLKEAGEYREGIELIVDNIEHFWREGFWSDVRKVLEDSLDFFNDEEKIAAICTDLGTITRRLGEWDKALEYHEKHLEIAERLNDVAGKARAYGNLGTIYHDKGEWDKALEYYKKDLEIAERLNNVAGIALVYGNLGEVYFKKGEFDKAIEYYEKSLEILKELGNIYNMAYIYRNTGDISLAKKELNQALNWYQKALTIFEKLGAKHEIKITKDKIADTLKSLNNNQ